MKLRDFLKMFYSLGTDIEKLVLWQNGKCLGDNSIGDTRFIRPKHMNAKVKLFTVPKRRHSLVVILENDNVSVDASNMLAKGVSANETLD